MSEFTQIGHVLTWGAIPQPDYATTLQPELVRPEEVLAPDAYKRFSNTAQKDQFRNELISAVKEWVAASSSSDTEAHELFVELESLIRVVDEYGALMLERVVEPEVFARLVDRYDQVMASEGNETFLHNFVDVRSHPDILLSEEVNESFLHPLFVLMIAIRVGGPVRLVDVRAKDAEPISVLAQDNMLHIDNTPFNDEYKVLLTWERGTTNGPNGQNFTYLPGTHKLARQCQVDESGAWSSENGSIFITPESVNRVLEAQKRVRGTSDPTIIEVSSATFPVSTIFPAGSLVHHRFRTSEGQSRSCIIAAFHRTADNPGSLIATEEVADATLSSLLTGNSTTDSSQFIERLSKEASRIVDLLRKLSSGTVLELSGNQVEMPTDRFPIWFTAVTSAPPVSELRARKVVALPNEASRRQILDGLTDRVMFDKHGPIDLVLYSDSHEEVRKWARNSLRELSESAIRLTVDRCLPADFSLTAHDALTTEAIAVALRDVMSILLEKSTVELDRSRIDFIPSAAVIEPDMMRDSLLQFASDLAQAITRVDGTDSFRSTSLFAFLVADVVAQLTANAVGESIAGMLWRHYSVLAVAD